MLQSGRLDFIAITDHNTTDMAKQIRAELGDRIIVGEEIMTREGELIGLYLSETIPSSLSALETVQRIREQDGLVYVPHPFETVRKGMSDDVLQSILPYIDLIEVQNGRAVFQDASEKAEQWAREHDVPGVASSDAHGFSGWGKTYTVLSKTPNRQNLVQLMRDASYKRGFPGLYGMLYPKLNRWKKRKIHA